MKPRDLCSNKVQWFAPLGRLIISMHVLLGKSSPATQRDMRKDLDGKDLLLWAGWTKSTPVQLDPYRRLRERAVTMTEVGLSPEHSIGQRLTGQRRCDGTGVTRI